MFVTEDQGHEPMPDDLPNEEFGRQPPQDLAAEQSVLGGMMLSSDAIADVEKIRPGDFYFCRRTRRSTTRSSTCSTGRTCGTRSPSAPSWSAA